MTSARPHSNSHLSKRTEKCVAGNLTNKKFSGNRGGNRIGSILSMANFKLDAVGG